MAEVTLHRAAQREFREAVRWIRDDRGGRAAARFAARIQRMFLLIGEKPERHATLEDDLREAIAVRYPYSLIYRTLPAGDVQVIAVAHASREPGYWRGRA